MLALLLTGNALATSTVVVWGDNSKGQNVPAGLNNVTAISAGGNYHSMALKQDGTVVAWGWDAWGETNVPDGLNNVIAISAGPGALHSMALKQDRTVVAWGWNGYGQTDVPAGLTNVIAMSAGWHHSMALYSDLIEPSPTWTQVQTTPVPITPTPTTSVPTTPSPTTSTPFPTPGHITPVQTTPVQISDTTPPSITLSKQTVDLNKNGQLDEGENLIISYGANDESGVKSIKLLLDGNMIELRNNEGIYSFTTDPLSMGGHSIVVEAIDSKGNKKSEEMKINAARTGPSVYFPKSRYEVIEGEDVNVVLSAVNPIGNPKMEALLILKPPGNGISTYESDCKGFSGQCTGRFEIEPGDSIRSVSVRMRAEKAGEYQIDAEVYYQFENGQRSPTRYETLTLVAKPKLIQTSTVYTQQASISKAQGFEVILAGIGIIMALVLWRR